MKALATIDTRSLALFRIVTGVLLLLSVVLRWKNVDLLYTNLGIQSNVFMAFSPDGVARPTLLAGFVTGDQVRAFYLLSCVVFGLFLVGFRTRMMHVLSLLCVLSIHGRSQMFSYGGDDVMRSFLLWTAFLPLDRRWSVDAHLAARRGEPLDTRPVTSIAAFGVVLQLCLIYGFTFFDKLTPVWLRGEAIHYTLWMDELVSKGGVLMRQVAPVWLLVFLNWWTLVIEAAAPVLLLIPWKVGWLRLVALLPLAGLHIGIFATIEVALFSPTIMAAYLLLITPGGWSRLHRAAGRIPRLQAALAERPARAAPGDPIPLRGARWGILLREVVALSLAYAVVTNACRSSLNMPERYKPAPSWTLGWAYATNIHQRWGMFANPLPYVSWFSIDGRTADGRRVDPITGGPVQDTIEPGYAPRLGLFLYYLSQVMQLESKRRYAQDVEEFVWRSHQLPGRDTADRIVSFEARTLRRDSPPMGSREPGPTTSILLVTAQRPPDPEPTPEATR